LNSLTTSHSSTLTDCIKTETANHLFNSIEQINKHLQKCVDIESFDIANKNISNLQRGLHDSNQDIIDIQNRVRCIEEEALPSKATVVQVKSCVLRSHFEEIITELGNEIDNKAKNNEVIEIDQLQQSMMKQLDHEKYRLDLCMRFIDWFTQRGESYEHNIKLIDKHLEKLTANSNPRDRVPYSNQVRFMPVKPAISKGNKNNFYYGSISIHYPSPPPPQHKKKSLITFYAYKTKSETEYSEDKTKSLLAELYCMLKIGGI
jgi:hypothetical protein